MDNDEAISALVLLSRMRFACGDNGLRMQDELEEYLRGLKRDSDELAALKARIAGAVQSVRDAELFEDGIEADAHGLGIHTIADAYMAGRQHALDELDALLRLPVGEGE